MRRGGFRPRAQAQVGKVVVYGSDGRGGSCFNDMLNRRKVVGIGGGAIGARRCYARMRSPRAGTVPKKSRGGMGARHYRHWSREKCAQSLASYSGDGVLDAVIGGSSLSDVSLRVAVFELPRPLDGSSRRRGPAEDDVSLPEEVVRVGRRGAAAWLRASLTHSSPAGVAYVLSRRSRKRRMSSTK